jgi:hypothetical protein
VDNSSHAEGRAIPVSVRHSRHSLTTWDDDAALSETFAHLGMPNDKDSSSRADLAIITHMEDVDRYKGPPGEGTTASQVAGRVSIASDVRNSVDERPAR